MEDNYEVICVEIGQPSILHDGCMVSEHAKALVDRRENLCSQSSRLANKCAVYAFR